MPLPGVTSAKVGGRYEDRWTAHCVLRVLEGEAEWIYLEEPGTDGEGFEFALRVRHVTEHHQVKRQLAGQGAWSLAALASAGVLRDFRARLAEPDAMCVFASANAAQTLDDLADDATRASSWKAFSRGVLSYDTRSSHFRQLREVWQADEHETYELLKRIRVESIGESRLEYLLRIQAELLLDGPIATAPAKLIEIPRDRINERVGAAVLWADLEAAGFRPNPWRSSAELAARVSEVNRRFLTSRQTTLIAGQLIPRPETEQLREAVAEHSVVLVEGDAGSGKSDVLYGLTQRLAAEATPYLAFRLDRWTAVAMPEDLATEMRLPVSPPTVLAAVAQGRRCVLIIDQLDAISTASGRSTEFLECVDQMLRLAAGQGNMSVVLCCRRFDARNDARLRRLTEGDDERQRIAVGRLSDKEIDHGLSLLGIAAARIAPELRELLGVPLHLALLGQIAPVDTSCRGSGRCGISMTGSGMPSSSLSRSVLGVSRAGSRFSTHWSIT